VQQNRYSKHKILHLRTFIFGQKLKNVTSYSLRFTWNCKYVFVWWSFCHQATLWSKRMRFRRSHIYLSFHRTTYLKRYLPFRGFDWYFVRIFIFPIYIFSPALSPSMISVHIMKSLNVQFSGVSFCSYTLLSTLFVNVPNMWSSLRTKD
jgi:hypothetical protein